MRRPLSLDGAKARKGTAVTDRLLMHVKENEAGCWVWTLAVSDKGYGRIAMPPRGSGSTKYAHRVSYETFVGPIPTGFQIDHLCRNRSCINPAHLEAVVPQENARRATESRRRERAA